MLQRLSTCMNAMLSRVGALDPHTRVLFEQNHGSAIEQIQELTGDRAFPELRTFCDRLLAALQRTHRTASRPDVTTPLFENFIHGITYFRNQAPGTRHPLYHRLLSCGPGTHAFRDAYLRCEVPGMQITRSERRERASRILRCYTERLIYDAIWQREHVHMPAVGTEERTPQDSGHEFYMTEVHKDFETCFPSMRIQVEVQYDPSGSIPVRALVLRFAHNTVTSKELYQKSIVGRNLYGPTVEAARWTSRQSYIKTQSFDQETSWRPVTGDAVARMSITPTPTQTSMPAAAFQDSARFEMGQRFGGGKKKE